MKFKNFAEREMTKKEKAKEKRLKKKYDDSDMKKDMKDRYGEDWKEVYYATIRKKAMEQFTIEAMQSFPYKIYNDDEMLIADDLESALEILDGEVSEQDLEQIEDMAMSGDVVPLLDTLDGFGYKVELEEKKSLASLRNRSSFDAVNRQLNKQKRRDTAKIELPKPRQLDLFNSVQKEGEAGDHDRMYKVVHVKKGMMDIKAKTSYEAAKKFAKEKGLKSTAGVDVHLYPLEEGAMSDLHARIMSSDDPHEEIYKMLTQDGPEAEYIQDMYNETSIDRGLHPDDDFEDIIDAMVAELDDDTPFENMNFMVAPPNKNPKFKSNMPIKPPNKNPRINTDFYKRMQKSFQQQDQEKPWWMREGYTRLPDIDRERYTEMPGLEGPFQTMSGKPIYYDPKEGSYYDRDTDMYLTYAEFKALDDPKPNTGRIKEGNSPHKKGTKKYKAHMAAMHANSVDLNSMRDALKLDESTDANTVIAEYTRATLDLRHDTWGKVCEQIDFIRSFVKDDIDIKNVQMQIKKMHEREKLDRNITLSENIDKLRKIVANKSAMPIKFADGSMKIDMTTANIFVQMYDKMKERNQKKIDNMMQTKAGFLKVLDFFYGAMK